MTIALADLRTYLDGYLRIAEVPDEAGAVNGLQVENRGGIGSIVAAVDASQATIDGVVGAIGKGLAGSPPLLLVHHGLFWDGNQPVVGRRYRRLRALLDHDIAVYAAHIPSTLRSATTPCWRGTSGSWLPRPSIFTRAFRSGSWATWPSRARSWSVDSRPG
ncbi:MAG: hypothetical protein H6R40_1522 [Gemmatimonadetes bacterium]|nr:hypothetical protein [Gemmatimonadota bacterium]